MTTTATATAQLTNGRKVEIRDRHYMSRANGETILRSVETLEGRIIPARDVQYIY